MEYNKWKKKKEKASTDGNLNGIFFACKELAEIYFRNEKYDEALKEYKEMEKACEASGNKMDYARAHRMIGEVYCEKGQFEKAIKHQMIHLSVSRGMTDSVEEQRALATLGRTYFLQSESFRPSMVGPNPEKTRALHMAKSYYVDSLNICERLSDGQVGCKQRMEMRARLFLNLGLVLESQGKVHDAVEHINKAVSICKKFELLEDLYRCQSALGSVYHRSGDSSAALKSFDAALQHASKLPNRAQLTCDILPLKAEVLIELPDLRGARQVLLRAYKLKSVSLSSREEIERKLRTVAAMCKCEAKLADLLPDRDFDKRKKLYEQIADMASALRNYSVALTYYHLMLECVKKCGADKSALVDSYVSLAQTYKDNSNYEKALEYFKLELEHEMDNPSEACKTSLNVAEVLQVLGHRDEMVAMYDKAKQWANTEHLRRIVGRCYRTSVQESGIKDNLDSELITLASLPVDLDDSDVESEDERREFGSEICLEDLTDPEDIDENEDCAMPGGRGRGTRTGKSFLRKRNEKGETPLHLAAIEGNAELIKKLIDQGLSLDVRDYSGWTPLHEACNHGNMGAVEALVEAGAHVNDRGGPHCDGVTPLLDAASNGYFEIVEYLLEHGASPLVRTNKGESVLDCLSGWRKRYLEDTGQDLNGTSLNFYNNLYRRLVRKLENAGHKVKAPDEISKEMILTEEKGRNLRRSHPQHMPLSPVVRHRTASSSSSSSSSSSNDWSDLRRNLDFGEVHGRRSNKLESGGSLATAEYQNAIQALRNRHKPSDKISLSVSKKPAGSALLTENETVGDDWLEDDLKSDGAASRPKKKRKLELNFIGEPLRKMDGIQHPRQYTSFQDLSSDDSDIVAVSTQPTISGSTFSTVQNNRTKCGKPVRKRQVSLLATGVSREKVKHPDSSSAPVTDHQVDVGSLTRTSPPQPTPPIGSVKVRIEKKLFLVPVPGGGDTNLTVGWLAKEASSRYYSLEGVEPETLRLQTEDGALLAPGDPLSLVMGQVVVGTATSWTLPDLNNRYQQLCSTMNQRVDTQLSSALDACQATGVVSVEEMYLSMERLTPLLKALANHHPLQTLNLSGNFIGDRGLKVVTDCITNLPQLEVLDLSCINITCDGLSHLSHTVSDNRALQRLHTLKLGYNRLGDCLHQLTTLLSIIPCLQRLSLPSIAITTQHFRNTPARLSFDSLKYLNLSCNQICGEGVSEVLGRLNVGSIECLRLAGTGRGAVAEVAIFLHHFGPPALKLVDLSNCQATKAEISNLVEGLERTPSVEMLRLESNRELDEEALAPLFNMMQLRELRVAGTNLTVPPHPPSSYRTLLTCSVVASNQVGAKSGPYALNISSSADSNISNIYK